MRSSRGTVVAWTLLLLSGTLGCRSAPSVGAVRAHIEAELPGAEFEPEFHLRLGRLSLGLVKTVAGWGLEEDDEDLAMLRRITHVDIGTYRVVSLPPPETLRLPADLTGVLDRTGWSLMARTRGEDEWLWLFVRQDGDGTIRSIYVVALDRIELTMVSVEGRLDEIFAEAIADDPAGFASSLGS